MTSSTQFFTVVTQQGLNKITQAVDTNQKIGIKWMAFGDGNGATPQPNANLTTYRDWETDRKSTRLNSSHSAKSRMPSSA